MPYSNVCSWDKSSQCTDGRNENSTNQCGQKRSYWHAAFTGNGVFQDIMFLYMKKIFFYIWISIYWYIVIQWIWRRQFAYTLWRYHISIHISIHDVETICCFQNESKKKNYCVIKNAFLLASVIFECEFTSNFCCNEWEDLMNDYESLFPYISLQCEKYKDTLACLMITYPSTNGVFDKEVRYGCLPILVHVYQN